jgi:DNA-binding beta-propeller fold protein YncE
MSLDRRAFLGAGLAAAGCTRSRGPAEGYALVANQEGHSLAVVDLRALAVVRHIRLGEAPTAVIAHPTRPVFYVLTPASGTVHEVTTEHLAITRSAATGGPADLMRPAPTGDSVWVMSRSARRLRQVSLAGMRAGQSVALPAAPVDFDLSADRAAVSFADPGQGASLFSLATGKMEHSLPTASGAGTLRFRFDGKQVLVGQPGARMLSLFDTRSGELIANLPLALEPQNFCFNHDGGQLFITGPGRDAVVVVFPYVTDVTETALAGRAPGAMAASQEFLFIASPDTGDVSIFEIETRKVIAVVAVGAQPVFIAVTPSNRYALVLNRQSGDVGVLLIPAIEATRAKRAALFTMIPVGSGPVSAAIQQA